MPYWSLILLALCAAQPALAAEDAGSDDDNGGTEEPAVPEDPDC